MTTNSLTFENESTYEVMDRFGYVAYFYEDNDENAERFISQNPGSYYIKYDGILKSAIDFE